MDYFQVTFRTVKRWNSDRTLKPNLDKNKNKFYFYEQLCEVENLRETGKLTKPKTTAYERFLVHGELFCIKHGWHSRWRLQNKINPKLMSCNVCNQESKKRLAGEFRIRTLLVWSRQRAKKKNLKHTVTEKYLSNILSNQNYSCALTGIKFTNELKYSLDRIDSSKGYIKGNVQFVLSAINSMKMATKESNFIEMCTAVAKFKERKEDD
jgi:hypothetical protein